MTQDEAREILNDYVTSDYFNQLPIEDVLITHLRPKKIKEVNLDWEYEEFPSTVITDYTFKGLLKIAYDLKDKTKKPT